MDRHLRAGMKRQIRHDFPGQFGHAKILYQNGISASLIKEPKIIAQSGQFLITDDRIHRDIDQDSA